MTSKTISPDHKNFKQLINSNEKDGKIPVVINRDFVNKTIRFNQIINVNTYQSSNCDFLMQTNYPNLEEPTLSKIDQFLIEGYTVTGYQALSKELALTPITAHSNGADS